MNLSSKAKKKLLNLPIGIVYLFGSQVQGKGNSQGDFDVGVVFADTRSLKNFDTLHANLYALLAEEFPVTFAKDIDIAYLQQTSLAFQHHVISEGRVLFERDPVFRADYEEKVIREYLDFRPVEGYFSEGLLTRLR
jgi:predicted nucleotidyltransferase